MIIKANAKINMTLDVLDRLPDGYHKVSMVMQEISLCDKIEIRKKPESGISVKVSDANLPLDENNIAYKAAKVFLDRIKSDDGVEIIIEKHIPVCAGLGGGSADGAAVLKAMNFLYGSPLSQDELLETGLTLGADVPFCIMGKTAHAGGIGEILTPFSSKLSAYVALIKPDADISTPEAYKAIDALEYDHIDVNKVIDAMKNNNKNMLRQFGGNVFEYVCVPRHPEIDKIKSHFKNCGAFFTMMSGSGPTVFGLFESMDKAKYAVDNFDGICQSKQVCELVL